MRAKVSVEFVARVVFLGEPEPEPAISHNSFDLSRLLLHRLEVLAAALHQLERLRSNAAQGTGMMPRPTMQFFSSALLFHTLRTVLSELENSGLDQNSPALVQLKHTLSQQIADLAASRRSYGHPPIHGTA